jgi:acetyl esterase/lipase
MKISTYPVIAIFALGASCLSAKEPKQIFSDWDKDKDGKLTLEELPRNARPNFKRVDTNQDGSISLAEHMAFLNRSRQPRRTRPLPEGVIPLLNLSYADTDNPRQTLDLFLPEKRTKDALLPIIVYIHGGGWKNGRKESGMGKLAPYLATGSFAAASINYRLSGESIWPAQIHDCKAALRWLKGNAKKYGFDAEKMAVWGNSAGGHLVAMLGVSGGVKALEGKLGKHLDQDSRVSCVVDFCGPTHFLSMGKFPSNIDHDAPNSPESQLLGGAVQENKKVANKASPMTYVTKDDAPTIIVHGTEDPLVPFNQAEIFHKALTKVGVKNTFLPMEGMGHGLGGPVVDEHVRAFLDNQLLGKK